jgi:hypothetical protein
MINYLQETASNIVYPAPHETRIPIVDRFENQTSGTNLWQHYLPFSEGVAILSSAWQLVRSLPPSSLTKQATEILTILQQLISTFRQMNFNLGNILQLNSYSVDDGSILFEWAFPEYRLGFNIETDVEESGWYLISTRQLGAITASGSINSANAPTLVLWLLNFIIANS